MTFLKCDGEFATGRDADPLTCDLREGHVGPHVEADFSSKEKIEWRTASLEGLYTDLAQSETDRQTILAWLNRGTQPQTGMRYWGGVEHAVSRILGIEPDPLPGADDE